MDVLACSEELGFHEFDDGVEFGYGSRVILVEFFATSDCVREFFDGFGYLNLESVYIGRDGG